MSKPRYAHVKYLPPSNRDIPPNWLTAEEKNKINEHNRNLGFVWNEDAQQYVSSTDHINETTQFISVNGRRILKPEFREARNRTRRAKTKVVN